jgi:hypothetical protein
MEQIFILSYTKPTRPVLTNQAGTIYCDQITLPNSNGTTSNITSNIANVYYEYDAVPRIKDTTGSTTVTYQWYDHPLTPTQSQNC